MLGTAITGCTVHHTTLIINRQHQQTDHYNQSKEENSVLWPLVFTKAMIMKSLIHFHSSHYSHLHLTWVAGGIIYTGGAIIHTEAITSVLQWCLTMYLPMACYIPIAICTIQLKSGSNTGTTDGETF